MSENNNAEIKSLRAPPILLIVLDKYLFHNYSIIMKYIVFEWDKDKNEANKKKHGISFEEAESAFYDGHARVIDDIEHSDYEERFILLGFSDKANLLAVCHCYRVSDTVVRIISARKATTNEYRQYQSYRN